MACKENRLPSKLPLLIRYKREIRGWVGEERVGGQVGGQVRTAGRILHACPRGIRMSGIFLISPHICSHSSSSSIF